MQNDLHRTLGQVCQHYFDDPRTTFGDLRLEWRGDEACIIGDVLDRATAEGVMRTVRSTLPHIKWCDAMTPLVSGQSDWWAVVTHAVTDVRRDPAASSERVSQLLFGEAVEILLRRNNWCFVRLHDGYLGWVMAEPLNFCSADAARSFVEASTHVVCDLLVPCYAEASDDRVGQVALLPFGATVLVEGEQGRLQCIRWPDGTERWVASASLLPRDRIPQHDLSGLRLVSTWLPMLIGVPYLWGGKTPFGYDCSGLVQVLYSLVGIRLRRDADQQMEDGVPVTRDEVTFGDLLFFDTGAAEADLPVTDGEVTHVAFALDHDTFIHASRSVGGVGWGSFDAASPYWVPSFEQRLLGVRRYLAHG